MTRENRTSPVLRGTRLAVALGMLVAWTVACDLDYPEVVVVNRISPDIVIRDPGFNGCRWNVTLGYGETTVPKRCLPGEDRVHFKKLDLGDWAEGLAEADAETPEPMWFNYQTITVRKADVGDFRVFEVTADDMEQDFSVPGPYGH